MPSQESRSLELPKVGSVKIADEVVAVIAGVAASDVEGVVGMSGGLVGDLGEILGKKSLSNGVKVQVGEKEAIIDLFIVVEYGARIPDVAYRAQQSVKSAVQVMTGLTVIEVNIHIQGVVFPDDEDDDDGKH